MTSASVLPQIENLADDAAARFAGVGTGVTDVRTGLSQRANYIDSHHAVMPLLVSNVMQGTWDDPVVVSDDSPSRKLETWRTKRLNAIHSQLAPNSVRTGVYDHIVAFVDTTIPACDSQVGYFDAILSTLEPETRNRKAALVEYVASRATSSAWHSFLGFWDSFSKATPEEALMRKLRAVLEPIFSEAEFQATSTYEDGIGGLVVDFLKSEERVTIILEEDRLQVLFVEDDDFASTVFDNASANLAEVFSFARSKFA